MREFRPPRSLAAFALALVIAAPSGLAAQSDTAPVRLLPESRMWLDGESNVSSFTCRTRSLHRSVAFGRSEVREIVGMPPSLARTLKIPVRAFRCGNERMERDMYRALQADSDPFIHFTLYSYVLPPGASGEETFPASAVGRMTIAGRERVVEVDVMVVRSGPDRFRVRGTKPIRMTDFGIEPPSALLGLVRARDRVVIGFDLLVEPLLELSRFAGQSERLR